MGLEFVQRNAMKISLGAGQKSDEEQLRGLGVKTPSLEKRKLRGDPSTLYSCLRGGSSQVGVGFFSQVKKDRTRRDNLKLHQGSFSLDIRKNFFPRNCD